MPSFTDNLFGTKTKTKQFPTLTPEQQQLINQLIGGLGGEGGALGGGLDLISQLLGGNQQFLEQMQQPELRRFEEQTIPGIAERFTAGGAQRSSGFQQALGGAGADLAERLAGQRAGMGAQSQQAGLQGLLSLLGIAQQPQFATGIQPGTPGALGGLLGGLGGGLGSFFGRGLFGG